MMFRDFLTASDETITSDKRGKNDNNALERRESEGNIKTC